MNLPIGKDGQILSRKFSWRDMTEKEKREEKEKIYAEENQPFGYNLLTGERRYNE